MDTSIENELLSKKNVVAVAKGEKWTAGRNTGEDALLVFVTKKKNKRFIRKKDLVPNKIGGMHTDVVGKTGTISAFSNTSRVRPIRPGYSCGHLWVTAGTIGAFFKDKDDNIVGLSNNHVLAAVNRGNRWDGYRGHWTVQPGVYDDNGWRKNKIGNLKDYKNIINGDNFEDSAIFRLDDESNVEYSIYKIGEIMGFNDNINVGDILQKTGRTTDYKKSSVIANDATVNVDYGRFGVFRFKDQIITNSMSAGGDSGSLTLDMQNNAAGLLFAGSRTVTIHNKIKYPRETYGLKIIGNEISEDISFSIKINGDTINNNYSITDINEVIKNARIDAKNGKDVDVAIFYSVNP